MGEREPSFDVLLVTGMSGAGRSTAARALEDAGWFVIDNIPPMLLGAVIDVAADNPDVDRVAVVVDARGGSFFPQLAEAMDGLRNRGVRVGVLFLEASEESLVRRFESSRRPHPLQEGARILDGLRRERLVLGDLRSQADLVIDTTNLNVHELRREIDAAFANPDERLRITVMSFGFKHGGEWRHPHFHTAARCPIHERGECGFDGGALFIARRRISCLKFGQDSACLRHPRVVAHENKAGSVCSCTSRSSSRVMVKYSPNCKTWVPSG